MSLCSKQVSSDGLDWEEGFKLDSGGLVELPKRRQSQNPQPDPLPCPRCSSKNTKFCYYNNYNKLQPRYFCKACKRHWTKGGSLRNVPVGGGRKNKRLKTVATSSKAANNIAMGNNQSCHQIQNPSVALGDQKDIFGILSQGSFISRGSNVNSNFFANSTSVSPLYQNQVPPFTFSSIGPLEIESTPSLNDDTNLVGLGSLEETNTGMPSTIWQGPITSMGVASSWNWDDVGPLVLPDQLNIDWDDSNLSHDTRS